jgi:hypothetical protein
MTPAAAAFRVREDVATYSAGAHTMLDLPTRGCDRKTVGASAMNELTKFRASGARYFRNCLIFRLKNAPANRLDIAGVASSILATPTIEIP